MQPGVNLVGNSICLKQLFAVLASELGHFPNLVHCVAGKIHWHKEGVALRWELAPREWDEVGILSFNCKCIAVQRQQGGLKRNKYLVSN